MNPGWVLLSFEVVAVAVMLGLNIRLMRQCDRSSQATRETARRAEESAQRAEASYQQALASLPPAIRARLESQGSARR